MSFSDLDHAMMALALQDAVKGLFTTDPNPRVGCVLVKNGQVIGRGWHEVPGGPHAEINALMQAGAEAEGADCYVTLEPCSHYGKTGPCAEALIKARIARVIIAGSDPNPAVSGQGILRLQEAGISTETGCLEEQAEALNPGFLKRMRTGIPWVRVKMATSLDGKTALSNGRSQWITGPDAREDVQKLRARSSAVLTGSGTLKADNPALTVRSEKIVLKSSGKRLRQPFRAVLDSSGVSRPEFQLFNTAAESLIFTSEKASLQLKQKQFGPNVEIIPVTENQLRLDLPEVLKQLGKKGCNEVLVEAGAVLAGSFIQENLADELWLYQATRLLGQDGRAAFNLSEYTELDEVPGFELEDIRQIGADIRMILRPK